MTVISSCGLTISAVGSREDRNMNADDAPTRLFQAGLISFCTFI